MKNLFLKIGIVVVGILIILMGWLLIRKQTYKPQDPIATIVVEGYENPIKIKLNPEAAPNAVANFVKLANNGFYTDFKMTIDEDRILGNESMEKAHMSNLMEYPDGDYVYGVKGDFIQNGVDNLIKHKKGVITMERDDYSYFGMAEEGYNSANCNFAILTKDMENYNGYYAAFGEVIEGMDVLDAIAAKRVEKTEDTTENTETTATTDNTENTIVIKSISVDTFGIDYGMPEVVNYEEIETKVNQIYSQYFGGSSSTNIVTGE